MHKNSKPTSLCSSRLCIVKARSLLSVDFARHSFALPAFGLTLLALLLINTGACSSDDSSKKSDAKTTSSDAKSISPDTTGTGTSDTIENSDSQQSGTAKLTITSPMGGEEWSGGSTQQITWATNLEDVAISYSADGGQTWTPIEFSLDTTSPNWQNYPWEVPNTPTTKAQIEIKGYNNEITKRSNIFTIKP